MGAEQAPNRLCLSLSPLRRVKGMSAMSVRRKTRNSKVLRDFGHREKCVSGHQCPSPQSLRLQPVTDSTDMAVASGHHSISAAISSWRSW